MNKRIRRITFHSVTLTLLLAYSAVAQHVTSPIAAKLVVPDAKVLPGVPFDMWVEVTNQSDATLAIGLYPRLLAHLEGGEPFATRAEPWPKLLGDPDDLSRALHYLSLGPGEKKTLTLPLIGYSGGSGYFKDYRLFQPGRYVIALRLDAFPDSELGGDTPPLTFAGPVTTNEVAVERIVPTGSDAKVWQRMQQLADGRWSPDCLTTTRSSGDIVSCTSNGGPGIWGEVLAKYPDSNYVPYALISDVGLGEKYLKSVGDAIARFPESPVIELLHLKALGASIGSHRSSIYDREWDYAQRSTRPTTRILVFGREDLAKKPCPPDYDCEP